MCLIPSERSSSTFDEQLLFGQIGERIIKKWLKEKGYPILPVREDAAAPFKGPRIESANEEIVCPDILVVAKQYQLCWVEVKTKQHFEWGRLHRCWMTGFDRPYLPQYIAAGARCNWPVWVFFLHMSTRPSHEDLKRDCPRFAPAGLYGQEVFRLAASIDAVCGPESWAPKGMYFWKEDSLILLAEASEFAAERKKRCDQLFDDNYIPGFD